MNAYLIHNKWDDDKAMVCVIADSVNEAKSIAFKDETNDGGAYIDLRCQLCESGDITGLTKGIFDDEIDGMVRGLWSVAYYRDCPNCGTKETTVTYDNGFTCTHCENEITLNLAYCNKNYVIHIPLTTIDVNDKQMDTFLTELNMLFGLYNLKI